MSHPDLVPAQSGSVVVLPVTGTATSVDGNVPYRIYSDETSPLYSTNFLSGAVEQVAYVYKKLGGDILDIELTPGNVYSAYEEATLEYSYIVNVHQATNMLSDALGNTTGTFDHKGNLEAGELSSSLGNPTDASKAAQGAALKFTKFEYSYAKRVTEGVATQAGTNGSNNIYSASFIPTASIQDYNLQTIVSSSAMGAVASGDGDIRYTRLIDGTPPRRIVVKQVFYKTPHAMWRFFGYYGGLNVVGNLGNYGQFSDDSTFQLVPAWQNKAQALAYEDAIYTRMSHFSYEIHNNNLRIFPAPSHGHAQTKMWVKFSIPEDAWSTESDVDDGTDGVNNMNTLPLGNIPYKNINSIGKQWIRRFALALSKEMLGQVRSKFGTVPIPGESVTLNGSDLISQAQTEQDKLREELKSTLAELTYAKLVERDAAIMDNTNDIQKNIPTGIFTG